MGLITLLIFRLVDTHNAHFQQRSSYVIGGRWCLYHGLYGLSKVGGGPLSARQPTPCTLSYTRHNCGLDGEKSKKGFCLPLLSVMCYRLPSITIGHTYIQWNMIRHEGDCPFDLIISFSWWAVTTIVQVDAFESLRKFASCPCTLCYKLLRRKCKQCLPFNVV